ncbi:Peptidyl-prolyl cis-trans isomerase FKBP53 [Linum perenne]
MGFWGVEVKPGKPHAYQSDDVQGTLYITQATLGLGSSKERSILQCSREHDSPIFLCSLLPGKTESCSLLLEFKDELVAFSVVGKRSIHLSGYFVADEGDYLDDEYLSDSGEDIADTESGESSVFDSDDDEDDEEEDDLNMLSSYAASKSGVVIEELTEDDKPAKGKKSKNKNDQKKQIVVKSSPPPPAVSESEDEDGFPVSTTEEVKDSKKNKRKLKATEPDSQPEKKKKLKQKGKKEAVAVMEEDHEKESPENEIQPTDAQPGSPEINETEQMETEADAGSEPPKKSKKKKNKNKKATTDADVDGTVATVPGTGNDAKSSLVSNEKSKPSKVRTFSNGLVIEELAMGKPDGKRASPGNQVSVHYIGKLQKGGNVFDSNVGKDPFKFRLGVGQVIKGWDVGVSGMRVGDKRRITIPPAMGYGEQGAGSKIPPNSWLVFDVELVNVR